MKIDAHLSAVRDGHHGYDVRIPGKSYRQSTASTFLSSAPFPKSVQQDRDAVYPYTSLYANERGR